MTNWNKKLDQPIFHTFRLWTEAKAEYYASLEDLEVDIWLAGRHYCYAELIMVEYPIIEDIPMGTLMVDTGLIYYEDIMEIFRKFYQKKHEWKEQKTKMIMLTFQRKR